jgi:hypothetical protein
VSTEGASAGSAAGRTKILGPLECAASAPGPAPRGDAILHGDGAGARKESQSKQPVCVGRACCSNEVTQSRRLKLLELLLRNLKVAPGSACKRCRVFAPPLRRLVLALHLKRFLTLGFQQPMRPIFLYSDEVGVVGAQVHVRIGVLDGEAEDLGQLAERPDVRCSVQKLRESAFEGIAARHEVERFARQRLAARTALRFNAFWSRTGLNEATSRMGRSLASRSASSRDAIRPCNPSSPSMPKQTGLRVKLTGLPFL